MATITSLQFSRNVSGAKRAARKGPVFITRRGQPTHVLLTIEDYRRLARKRGSIADALAQTGPEADFAFDPPKLEIKLRPAEFD
jgi:prevent-host-death family protein